jgi:hypothetical protein
MLARDTAIPYDISASEVANFTSEVRLGIYIGPPPPNEVYMQWVLYDPANSNGAVKPLYFYGMYHCNS